MFSTRIPFSRVFRQHSTTHRVLTTTKPQSLHELPTTIRPSYLPGTIEHEHGHRAPPSPEALRVQRARVWQDLLEHGVWWEDVVKKK